MSEKLDSAFALEGVKLAKYLIRLESTFHDSRSMGVERTLIYLKL